MANIPAPQGAEITVAGGTGSVITTRHGRLIGVGIRGPVGATYDIDIADEDGFGLMARVGLSGDYTLVINIQLWKQQTITLSNATDGAYSIKLWFSD